MSHHKNLIYQSSKTEKINLTQFKDQAFKDDLQVAIRAVSLTSADGHQLRGIQTLYHGARTNILLFGGNGTSINDSSGILHRLGRIPANIIWFDYPGVGASDKARKLNSESLMADALAMYDFAVDRLRNNKPFVVHGIEMGSVVAANVAMARKPDGLVLEAPIVNLSQLIHDNAPRWGVRFRLSEELAAVDNAYQVGSYQGSLLILVGEKDMITPPKYGKVLYEVSPSRNKHLVIIEGAGHDKLMASPLTVDAYQAFIDTL